MRPLESYVVYLALYGVWGESAPGARWALWALLLATLAHLLLERPRWQLGLLYGQVAHLLYAAASATGESSLSSSWTFIALSSLAILATSALACLLPIAKFPELSGRFQSVGVVQRFLPTTNGGDSDSSTHQHAHPEIGVTVFYPASLVAPTRSGAQFLAPNVLPALAQTLSMPAPVFAHLSLAKIRAVTGLPMAAASATEGIPQKFPVLIMSHGLTGVAGMYSMQACELASQGYIVFAPTHNDGSACVAELPLGRSVPYTKGLIYGHPQSVAVRAQQLETRVQEVALLIDTIVAAESGSGPAGARGKGKGEGKGEGWPVDVPFAGRLDTSRLGLVGHSFGGATAVASAARDPRRVKAVVSHDVWMEPVPAELLASGLKGTPALHTLSQQWFDWTESRDQTVQFAKNSVANANSSSNSNSGANVNAGHAEESQGHTSVLSFPGTRHSNYSDVPLFSQLLSRKLRAIGAQDFRTAMRHINQAQVEFLDKHVKGARAIADDTTAAAPAQPKSAASSPASGKRMFDALLKSKAAVTVPIHQAQQK